MIRESAVFHLERNLSPACSVLKDGRFIARVEVRCTGNSQHLISSLETTILIFSSLPSLSTGLKTFHRNRSIFTDSSVKDKLIDSGRLRTAVYLLIVAGYMFKTSSMTTSISTSINLGDAWIGNAVLEKCQPTSSSSIYACHVHCINTAVSRTCANDWRIFDLGDDDSLSNPEIYMQDM